MFLVQKIKMWMKTQRTDFYIGIVTGLSVSIVLLNYSEPDNLRIQGVTYGYPLVPALLFSLFVVGFTISNGIFPQPTKKNVRLIGLGLSSLAAMLIITVFGFNYAGILTIILSAQLPEFFSIRKSLSIALSFSLIGNLVDFLLFDAEYALAGFILYGLFNIFALYASSKAINEEKAKIESQRLLRELKSTQILLAATIKRAERVRISQDLHDVFGHHLTALSLQLEVASHVSGEKVYENIGRAKSICGLLLADVREAVSEIKKNGQLDLRETLISLTQNIPGLNVTLEFDIDELNISDREAEVLFRCAQESITNCLKHAGASRCNISLLESESESEKKITLKYKDNGVDDHQVIPGNGLIGLLERVASVDGKMSFGNSSDGFFLEVILERAFTNHGLNSVQLKNEIYSV